MKVGGFYHGYRTFVRAKAAVWKINFTLICVEICCAKDESEINQVIEI